MNQKPSITFVKKTKNKAIIKTIIKTITIDKFHKKALEKFFFSLNKNIYHTKELSDITCIHIKDYTFNNNTKILNLEKLKGKLILENCIFEGNLNLSEEDEFVRYLTLKQKKYFCDIEIINPKINGTIHIECANDVTITLLNDINKINLDINYVDTLTINGNDTNTINSLRISRTEKVIINNIKHILDIGEKITTNNLYLNNATLDIKGNMFKNDFKASKKLKLENSHIKSEIDLDIIYLFLKNSTITAIEDIYIPSISNIEIEDAEEESILDTSSYIEIQKSIYLDDKSYSSTNNNSLILDEKEINKLRPKYIVRDKKNKNPSWILLSNDFWVDNLIENVINYVENRVVHIKNYTFLHHTHIEIKSPIKRTLIFEDCCFDGLTIDILNVDIELINPTCKTNENIKITCKNNVTVKSKNESTHKIKLKINGAKSFILINDKSIKELALNSEVNYIKDCNSLLISNNSTHHIILSNSNLIFLLSKINSQILTLENSNIYSDNNLIIKNLEAIRANNSRIKANELVIEKLPSIDTTNSYIEANYIKIGELTKNIDKEIDLAEFTLIKNELLQKRAYLTYLLKNIKDKTNTQISNIIEQEEKELQKKIEEEKNKILTKKRNLKNIKLKELQ